MQRRGLFAVLLAFFMLGGFAGIAAADTTPAPAPSISPPPQCFVVKNGALPTCEQLPDGTWSVIYPKHGGNLDGGSGSHTRRDVGLVIVIVCVAGIGVIIWRQWGASGR